LSAPSVPIKWAAEVAEPDYAAAEAYVSPKFGEDAVAKALKDLRRAALTRRRAKDMLRASGLNRGADIADGFHRASLVHRLDPHADFPSKPA
jgi:hypothetical protein